MACAKTLVARAPGGGASGTALSFPTDGTGVVTLDGANATGDRVHAGDLALSRRAATGERALFTCAGDPKSAGPSIWLTDRAEPAHRLR